MFVSQVFAWIYCITFVAVSGQFEFQSENMLRNLLVDSYTGEIYVGGTNYIYRLNENLTKLNEVYTPCLGVEKPCRDQNNTNQLLMIEDLTGNRRLFACGTYSFGKCVTYEMKSFAYKVLGGTLGSVSKSISYSTIALQDSLKKGIIIVTAKNEEGSPFYSLNTYSYSGDDCNGSLTLTNCLGRKGELTLSKNRPKMYYILAVIVGEYRYFFSHTEEGSSVARLCESYPHPRGFITYMEMPLHCVDKDGTNYKQLVAAKILQHDGKVTENFGGTGNDSDGILIGVFHKSSTSSQSAVCTYSFSQINEFFSTNIKKCFGNGEGIVNEYLRTDKKCQSESYSECPSAISKNQRMIGTKSCSSQSVITCNECGFISSMDATIYRGNVIAFVGAKTGELSKFVISSNSSGRMYETSSRVPGSSIISVNFDPSVTSAYLLSESKVLKIPVEECSNRTTCESCLKAGDPYCGWCTLHAKCTTYDKCPYFGSRLGYVHKSSECISATLIPKSLPLSEILQKVNISIVNLPVTQKKGAYSCSVNDIKMPSTLFGTKILECSVPKSQQLPQPSSETGLVMVEVDVYSNETGAKITSAMLKFYKCSAITSCVNCTTGSLKCSWCHYKSECSGDAPSTCPKSFAPWVGNSSHKCPQLDSRVLYIPASVERTISLTGTHLPKPESPDGKYKCNLTTAGGQLFSVAATWKNSTSITCVRRKYQYPGASVEVSASISVMLGKSDVKSDHVQVYLYQCRNAASQCGSCVGSKTKAVYECGWCNGSLCTVNDRCSEWVSRDGECPGAPKIQMFSPRTGHVKGNTRLVIDGTEFGRKYEDVKEVSIAGLPCRTIKQDYIIAKRIVCETSSSMKSLSAKIKLNIADKVGYSKEKFYYQDPLIENYEPRIGPVSGGTDITIFGKELDTGENITVFFGRSQCLHMSVTKTRITCKTSKYMNVTRKRRSVSNDGKLTATFDRHPAVYSKNITSFQYVPDPEITDITPRYTFPSSKRQINVTGTNLNGIHYPKIQLIFQQNNLSNPEPCDKPSFNNMMCSLPNLTRKVTFELNTRILLFLDGLGKWNDPKLNSLTIVPDPIIYKFPDGVHVLKTTTLEIKGKYLQVKDEKDVFEFIITIGGEKCNYSSQTSEVIFCRAPDREFLPNLDSYEVWVNISLSTLHFYVGKLKYDIDVSDGSSTNMTLIYIIVGVGGGLFVIFVILMCCLYLRKRRQQEQKERTYEMQMNSLESKVAKECREAFAELQTEISDFTTDLGDAGIHFFDFKNYAMRVLFPGVEHHGVMEEKMAPESPKWDEALRTFSQLIGNKSFLLIFVKTLESQTQFKMQDRCSVASLLVVALQSKMDYCTDILQRLLSELIRKSMSKSHPKLLLRRTECIAEKLLTNWLTFTMSHFIKDKAGKPLFTLYKAIRFQVEKGPVDVITNEARYSLSEDKLLRQSIDYNKLTVTVEFEDNPPVQVEVLDTDTIEQAKGKIMEVLFKNVPFSCRIAQDELVLKWVESPSNHTILKNDDATSVREGEWKRLNTLGHYQVPDRTCLRLVRRFASAFDTSDIHASLPKVSYSPSLYSTSSLVQSSKQNINDADRKPWHLTKHVDSYTQEKDDPRHSKLLSEIYLTRLLSTKGTLQQYVDDMFDCIFPTFRKTERPPLPIKFLFDFLDDQARELNITDPEVLHTWKNNSLPLRFWVNLIKNPNFLFDVYKAPIVDSCLSVIAQLFMDACSVSEHILGKDSPSNKLLYAKEIPAYRQKVESFYKEVANAPRLTEDEIKEFFAAHYIEDFNVDSALKELYKYAAKYQDELQEALEDARYPQLASKLEHVVAIFSDD